MSELKKSTLNYSLNHGTGGRAQSHPRTATPLWAVWSLGQKQETHEHIPIREITLTLFFLFPSQQEEGFASTSHHPCMRKEVIHLWEAGQATSRFHSRKKKCLNRPEITLSLQRCIFVSICIHNRVLRYKFQHTFCKKSMQIMRLQK